MLDEIKLEASKFHNVLKSLRVRRGMAWTQEATAELLGVKTRLYVGWENGEFIPSAKQLINIAVKFALSQEDQDMLYLAAAQAAPKIRHLPFHRNPLFTGRKSQLQQLHRYLQDNGSVALTQPVIISGLAGIGKTQLALEYAYRCYPRVYRAVLWVNAADEETLQASYGDLAEPLGLPEQHERELEKRVDAVKRWLEDHTNWLLIMDNADNLQLARSFFPSVDHARILLTTRSQIVGNTIARQIDIYKMEPAEGLLFLLKRTRMVQADTELDAVATDIRAAATQVVELLGWHPLALDQAGAFIEDTGVSFTEYIRRYHKARRDLLSKRGSLDEENKGKYSEHPDTVATTFDLCFEMARERHPLATDILRFCAFLHPDAIPMELFQHDDSFRLDISAFNKGVTALQRYSLITRNVQEQTFSMHRLVQAVLIDDMAHDVQKQWWGRVVRVLNAAFPEAEVRNWKQCERLLPHALYCAMWTKDELIPTPEFAGLTLMTGTYLTSLGLYSSAETLFWHVLSILEQQVGVENAAAAAVFSELSYLIYMQGKDVHTDPMLTESMLRYPLAILVNQLGVEHPITTNSMQNVASIYTKQGKYVQAEELLLEALSNLEQQLGASHPETAIALFRLASLYHEQRNYEQAESLYRLSLRILEAHLEAVHPQIGIPLYGLASLLYDQGRYDEADALYQRFVYILEQQLGVMHPYTQAYRREYTKLLRSLGRNDEAAVLEANDEPSV